MVGRYPAIKLMSREPIRHLVAHFNRPRCLGPLYGGLVAVSAGYPPVTGMLLTRYAPFRRSPPTGIATRRAAPRLACVKPAASVHPEPGSNSSLYISISLSLSGLELTSCFACLYFTSLFKQLSSFSSLSADLCVGLRLVCQSFTPVNSSLPHSSALTSTRNELQILFLPGTVAPSGDPLFVWGLQRYAFFISLQTFFHLFFIFFQEKTPYR